jgi:fatty acid desaturase
MTHPSLRAFGFFAVLIPPALLALAARIDEPYLLVGVVFLGFPLMRSMFGTVSPNQSTDFSQRVVLGLNWLPLLYAVALAASMAFLLLHLAQVKDGIASTIGWAMSLWLTLVFATCVAHELLHRKRKLDRFIGHALAGLAGYPVLGYEHNRHHKLPGNTAAAEWPKVTESVWTFSARRLAIILPGSLGLKGLAFAGDSKSPTVCGLRVATATTCATWLTFAALAGVTGALIYGVAICLVAFSNQLVTYMQHWGLGDDNVENAKVREVGWESDCQFQAWVTMGLSLHQSHHRHGSKAYYQIGLSADSPRLPAGYVLLMFAALIPPLWQRVAMPALTYWKSQPTAPLSSGRRLTCVALYK